MIDLTERVILVIGGGRGIGAAIVFEAVPSTPSLQELLKVRPRKEGFTQRSNNPFSTVSGPWIVRSHGMAPR